MLCYYAAYESKTGHISLSLCSFRQIVSPGINIENTSDFWLSLLIKDLGTFQMTLPHTWLLKVACEICPKPRTHLAVQNDWLTISGIPNNKGEIEASSFYMSYFLTHASEYSWATCRKVTSVSFLAYFGSWWEVLDVWSYKCLRHQKCSILPCFISSALSPPAPLSWESYTHWKFKNKITCFVSSLKLP